MLAIVAAVALGALATTRMTDALLRRLAWAEALPPLAIRLEASLPRARFAIAFAIGLLAAAALPGAAAAAAAVFGWLLLMLAWIDLRRGVLPDAATGTTAAIGLALAAIAGVDQTIDAMIGGILGFAVLAATAALYRRMRGADGLGGGDARLLGAIGCWLGAEGVAATLLGAALLGLAAVGLLRAAGRPLTRGDAVPFGPFLCAAAWSILVVRDAFGGVPA